MKERARRPKQSRTTKNLKTATWRAKPKAKTCHRKGMETKTVQALKLPADLEGARKLKWAPYAGRNLTYFLTVMHLRETYGKLYEPLIGIRFSHLFVEGSGTDWMMYRAPSESERLEAYVQNRCQDPQYVQRVQEQNDKNYDQFRRYAEILRQRDFRHMTPKQLFEALEEFRDSLLQMASSISCSIIFAGALARRLQAVMPESAVMTLALPLHQTLPLEEEKAFWKLVQHLQKKSHASVQQALNDPENAEAMQKHFEAYAWLDAYENDEPWTQEAFRQRLQSALGEDPQRKLAGLEELHQEQESQIEKTAKQYRIAPVQLRQFRLAMYHRILGESLLGLGNIASRPLFQAIAKALLLPQRQIKWFSDTELLSALQGNTDAAKLLGKLPVRQKHYLVALGEKQVHAFQGAEVNAVLSQLDIEKPAVADVKQVKGVSAYPGLVQGIARVVQHVSQLDKVQQGDILVTLNTTPSFIMAMKRSAAIVTDEGGITCHAAIVSRELGIPCIIGTKAGTKLIQDGAKIEVDAAAGIVRKLEA